VLENCVVMEDKDAERHVRECFDGAGERPKKRPEELWGKEVQAIVERRAEEVKRDREWNL
jgi:tRNA threonylcarbamoyladenosine dehydratase